MSQNLDDSFSRRRVIILMASALAAQCTRGEPLPPLRAELQFNIDLDATFESGSETARFSHKLGRAYALNHPHEDDPKTLCRLLFNQESPPLSHEMKRILAQRVRQDFIDDRLVVLNGWYVTQSEARLYCLASHYSLSPA